MAESLDIPGLSAISISLIEMRHENAKVWIQITKTEDFWNLNPHVSWTHEINTVTFGSLPPFDMASDFSVYDEDVLYCRIQCRNQSLSWIPVQRHNLSDKALHFWTTRKTIRLLHYHVAFLNWRKTVLSSRETSAVSGTATPMSVLAGSAREETFHHLVRLRQPRHPRWNPGTGQSAD